MIDDSLQTASLLRFILGEVPLDGGQQPDHVLLADLHRSTRPMERCGIGGDAADVGGPSQHEPAACRAAQGLAAAEQHEVGALLGEAPEIVSRRKLCGGIDDDRDVMPTGDVDQGGQWEDLAREMGLRNVEDRRRLRADRLFELLFCLRAGATRGVGVTRRAGAGARADLDEPAARQTTASYGTRCARWMTKSRGYRSRSATRNTPSSVRRAMQVAADRNSPAAAPPDTKAASFRVSSANRRPTAACNSVRSTKQAAAWRMASSTSGGISEPPRIVNVDRPLTMGSTPSRR